MHCYQEGEGEKGGDNVASLIMQALHDQGFIKLDDDGNPIHSHQLMIAADNCSSQNKINMVIQLVPWLVQTGFYREMELLFYVHGHTKNVCDCMFNQLKAGFHNCDIYTYNHPSEHDNHLSVLNQAEDVMVVDCRNTAFKQWGKYLDEGYTGIKDGQVLANHVFRTTHTNGETKLIIKTDETELAEHNLVHNLKKRGCSGPCRKLWPASMPDPIAPMQLPAMKQAKLYNKW